MELIKNIVIVLIAVVVSVGGSILFVHPSTDGKTVTLGSAATPDLPFSYLKWGAGTGVQTWPIAVNFTQNASSTCNIQSPNATTTLNSFGVEIDNASSTATIWEIGQSATPNATTTLIGTKTTLAASLQYFIQASTTPTAGAVTVFAPNTWLVVKAGGGITAGDAAAGGFVPTGTCGAVFQAYTRV